MKNVIQICTFILSLLLMSSVNSQSVIADFQVNENATNRWDQYGPSVLVHANNNYMIYWRDDQKTVQRYAQLFNSDGAALDDNFHLEELVGGNISSIPNKNGNIINVWQENITNINQRIFAQFFDSTWAKIGEKFQISEYTGNATESQPSIAFGADSTFIITFLDKGPRALYGDIYARRFAPDGTPLGSEFKVNNDNGTMTAQNAPNIASNENGEFIIGWQDFRVDFNGGDVYAQRYDKDGTKIGGNFRVDVDTPVDLVRQSGPRCSLSDSGKFFIAWYSSTWEHSNRDIYGQWFDSDGNRQGTNFMVTNGSDSLAPYIPESFVTAMNKNGKVLAAWSDNRDGSKDIYTQYYGSDGTAIGGHIKINDDEGDTEQKSPNVAADNNGDFILTWQDGRNNGYGSQIYMQKYAENGTLIGGNFHTTNEEPVMVSTMESDPSIVIDSEGTFTIVWYDARDGKDIYAQRYESNGVPVETNFRVNDELDDKGQYNPAAAVNAFDKLLVTWREYTNGVNEIYAQLYSSNGAAIGSNFKVNDDSAAVYFTGSAVSELGGDNFIVVWQDTRNDGQDIYARRIDGSGTVLDSSFKVNDDLGSASYPAVAVNDSGTFLIAWSNYSPEGTSAIYGQLYTPQGTPLGDNFELNNKTSGGYLRNTAIAALDKGQFVVVWRDNSYKDIYAQRIAGNGTLIDSTFQVGPDMVHQWQPPAVAADDAGNFIISWTDNRNEVYPDVQIEVFAQRFNSDGIPIGSDFSISENKSLPYQYPPDVKLYNNKIYTTWAERDRFDLGTGVDIWANVLDWNNPVSN